MNRIHELYNSSSSFIQDFSFDKLSHPQIAAVALGSLGVVAVAFSALRCCKKDPLLIQVFERRFRQANLKVPYVKMNGYIGEEDAKLLFRIFQTWHLDSGFLFFDLLGADLYRDWKSQGADGVALSHFCANFRDLATKIEMHMDPTMQNPHIKAQIHDQIKEIRKNLQCLQNQIPMPLKPKFDLFLKILSNPKITLQFGESPVQLFERTLEDQRGENRKDLQDMLEFATEQYPSRFRHLLKIKSLSKISKELAFLNNKVTDLIKNSDNKIEINNLYYQSHLMNKLKDTVDIKFLKTNIPISRVYQNILTFSNPELPSPPLMIQKKYSDFLNKNFLQKIVKMQIGKSTTSPQQARSIHYQRDVLNLVTGFCGEKSIVPLEEQILDMLKEERSKQIDPEAYAEFFTHSVRLYQIVHDIQFMKDPTQDYLQGSPFPKSFADMACLAPSPETEESLGPLPTPSSRKAEKAPSEIAASTPLEKNGDSFPDFSAGSAGKAAEIIEDEEVDETNQLEEENSDRDLEDEYAQFDDSDSKKPSLNVPSIQPRPIQRPYFPSKNATPEKVIDVLMNNGFVILRVSGGHYQMKHVATNVCTTVPYNSGVLKKGTLHAIRKAFHDSQ